MLQNKDQKKSKIKSNKRRLNGKLAHPICRRGRSSYQSLKYNMCLGLLLFRTKKADGRVKMHIIANTTVRGEVTVS